MVIDSGVLVSIIGGITLVIGYLVAYFQVKGKSEIEIEKIRAEIKTVEQSYQNAGVAQAQRVIELAKSTAELSSGQLEAAKKDIDRLIGENAKLMAQGAGLIEAHALVLRENADYRTLIDSYVKIIGELRLEVQALVHKLEMTEKEHELKLEKLNTKVTNLAKSN